MLDDDIDDTVIRPLRAPRSGDGRRARAADVDPEVGRPGTDLDGDDGPLGDTVVRPRADTPGAPIVGDGDDPDDTVRVRRSTPATAGRHAAEAPRLPAPPAPPAVPQRRVPSIRIGGRVVRLDHPVVIGRRPSLPRILRGPAPELVTVPSPRGQVSSSHLLVHAEGEAAVVDDLRSTNGTVIRPAGAPPFRMPSGASNVVLTGTVVEIGDGNVIEVLSPHLRVSPTTGDPDPAPAWPSLPPLPGTPPTPRERS